MYIHQCQIFLTKILYKFILKSFLFLSIKNIMSAQQKILQAKRKQKSKRERDLAAAIKRDSDDDSQDDKSNENKDEKPKDYIEESIKTATKMWDDIKKRVKDDEKFCDLSDNDKLKIYQTSEFKQFYNDFPIVCRYMICMGQFSHKAYKKFLLKCKNVVHDPIKSREKGYHDEQWVCRQSDYIKYLWESYQRQHYSPSEAKNIWMHAYKTLKKEFEDFKDLHKEVEEKIKTDHKSNKSELVKELLKRISSQEQELDNESSGNLLKKLKDQVLEQRKKKLIQSIENDIETTPPTIVAKGSRKELKPAK